MYFLLTIFLTQVLYSCLHATEEYQRCITKEIYEEDFGMKPLRFEFTTPPLYRLICNFNFTDVCLPVKISSFDELARAPLVLKSCFKMKSKYFCNTERFKSIAERSDRTYVFNEDDRDAKVFYCGKIIDDIKKCTMKYDETNKKRGSARLIDEFNCVKNVPTTDKPGDKISTTDKPGHKISRNDNPGDKISKNHKLQNKMLTNDKELVAIVAHDVIISNPVGDIVQKTHLDLKDVIEVRVEETVCTVAEGCRVVRQKFAQSAPKIS